MTEVQGLKKGLGFWSVYSMCLGLVCCSTTMMLLALGFGDLGSGFLWPQAVMVCYVLLVCFAFSELATMFPRASSLEYYTTRATNSLHGTMVGLWYGFKDIFGCAAECTVVGSIVAMFIPSVAWYWWAIIVLSVMMIFNLLGIAIAGRAQLIMVICILSSFVGLGLAGFLGAAGPPDWAYLRQSLVLGSSTVFGTEGTGPTLWVWCLLAVWLFVGLEVAAPLAEEIHDPGRTIPRAMIAALLTLSAAQAFLGLSWVATVPKDILLSGNGNFPHVLAAQDMFGTAGAVWFAIVSVFATGSTLNSVLPGASRVLYGMAQEGYIPQVFGWLHPRFRTPWFGLFCLWGGLILIIVLTGIIFEKAAAWVAAICCFVFLAFYFYMFIDVLMLRRRAPQEKRPFSMGPPMKTPILAVIGAVATIAILVGGCMPPWGDPTIFYAGGTYCGTCFLAALLLTIRRFRAPSISQETGEFKR